MLYIIAPTSVTEESEIPTITRTWVVQSPPLLEDGGSPSLISGVLFSHCSTKYGLFASADSKCTSTLHFPPGADHSGWPGMSSPVYGNEKFAEPLSLVINISTRSVCHPEPFQNCLWNSTLCPSTVRSKRSLRIATSPAIISPSWYPVGLDQCSFSRMSTLLLTRTSMSAMELFSTGFGSSAS